MHFKNNNGDFIVKCLVCDKAFDGILMKEWHIISKSCPSCKSLHNEYKVDYVYSKFYEDLDKNKKKILFQK